MTETKLVNLTPHALHVKGVSGEITTIEPCGLVARVATSQLKVGEINGIAIYETQFGEVVELPKPQENTFYIVSKITQTAAKGRTDLLSPGNLLRDEDGVIVGCEGLTF